MQSLSLMKRKLKLLLLAVLIAHNAYPATFAHWNQRELTLNNGVVERIIRLPSPEGHCLTTSYHPVPGTNVFFQPVSSDFQFELNGASYSGEGDWSLLGVESLSDAHEGDGAKVSLLSKDKLTEVTLKFLLYPDQPVIRKSLVVKNLGKEVVALESVDIERLNPLNWAHVHCWVNGDYGRRSALGPYDGTRQDSLVIVHNHDWDSGIVIGNEAPSVLKHTSAFWDGSVICSGLTHKGAPYPFRKWLAPLGFFETPQVFTMVYNHQKTPDQILNTAVPDFVRKHMGIRLSDLKDKPTFVYNTWVPFGNKINEKLIMELADAAAASGMKEFVIDDGWQDSYGDWGVDKVKFPHGLKPVFDHIKSLGMKPGLWVSVGSASTNSLVYQRHPEWFVENIKGKPTSLQSYSNTDIYTACFGTGWYDYIKGMLEKLMLENGLEYLKLDFSVGASPYVLHFDQSGCYASHHAGHKDHDESLYSNFEKVWSLFDELHRVSPGLFIDCTFETMGGLQLIDYAMVKHADGNWLSNFHSTDEKEDLRIRNMVWWRSPAIPATALVVGNAIMDDKGWENHIQSLAGALPILLGDPRKLSPENLKKYRGYADWLSDMQSRYDIMSFRQDLPGFGEPLEGRWDGFQRLNTDTKNGGIIGVFRQGALESQRTVGVNYLDPLRTYEVKTMAGKVISIATGKDLETKGFTVTLTAHYGGELFEIAPR